MIFASCSFISSFVTFLTTERPATLRRYQISFHKISNLPTPGGSLAIQFHQRIRSTHLQHETLRKKANLDVERSKTASHKSHNSCNSHRLLWCLQFGGAEKQTDSEVVLVQACWSLRSVSGVQKTSETLAPFLAGLRASSVRVPRMLVELLGVSLR